MKLWPNPIRKIAEPPFAKPPFGSLRLWPALQPGARGGDQLPGSASVARSNIVRYGGTISLALPVTTDLFGAGLMDTPCGGEVRHGVTSSVSREKCTKNWHRRCSWVAQRHLRASSTAAALQVNPCLAIHRQRPIRQLRTG